MKTMNEEPVFESRNHRENMLQKQQLYGNTAYSEGGGGNTWSSFSISSVNLQLVPLTGRIQQEFFWQGNMGNVVFSGPYVIRQDKAGEGQE